MNERMLKARLIDFILENDGAEDLIIASEVPYAAGRRRADIVKISKNEIYGFEIKSDLDSLYRLNEQMLDSISSFDYTVLVIAKKRLNEVKKNLNTCIGLIEYDQNKSTFVVDRMPKRRVRLNKYYISSFVWLNDAKKELARNGIKLNSSDGILEIRPKILNMPLASIKSLAINSIYKRYNHRFKLFMNEKGVHTHEDDLRILTIEKQDLDFCSVIGPVTFD